MSFSTNRKRLTQEQQLVMVEFLEKYPDLLNSRGKVNGKALWHVLAKKLNLIEGGVRKPSRSWAKTWFDKKCTLKKLLYNQSMEHKQGLPITHMNWNPVDMRIINMLRSTGELQDIDLDFLDKPVKVLITKAEISEHEVDSLPSHASSPTLPDVDNIDHSNERFENIEYLDADCPPNHHIENKLPKGITNNRRDSDCDPLHAEWSRVASMEEQRIEIEQKNSKSRKDTSEALNRCALAIESLAGAVNYQGNVISNALRAQGEAIAEALKAQGKVIAEALGKS